MIPSRRHPPARAGREVHGWHKLHAGLGKKGQILYLVCAVSDGCSRRNMLGSRPHSLRPRRSLVPRPPAFSLRAIFLIAVLSWTPTALASEEDTLSVESPDTSLAAAARIIFDQRSADINDVSPLITNYQGIVRFEFPRGARKTYLYGSQLLFGCIRREDTLVSEGPGVSASFPGEPAWEMNGYERIWETSSQRNRPNYHPDARAPQQFYMVYSDTAVVKPGRNPGYYYDAVERRPHMPIGLEVHQTTYAWADAYSQRFIIADYWLKNISSKPIEKGCVGIYADPDIIYLPKWYHSFTYRRATIDLSEWPPPLKSIDDICGFLREVPGILPGTRDTVNIAWAIDNDGEPANGEFDDKSPTGAIGVRVLRAPGGRFSFNWWVTDGGWSDWGPRLAVNRTNFYRVPGSPFGDRNRYRMMTNGEIDYDQMYTGISHTGDDWSPPPPQEWVVSDYANGGDCRMMLSYGPFAPIAPGDSVPFTVAFIAGARVHTEPGNYDNHFNMYNPDEYANHLDFRDLIRNGRWADWVFDNPGIDSDPNDGIAYNGKFYLIDCAGGDTLGYDTTITGDPPETTIVPITIMFGCDSVFYKGDGIVDLSGPQAPPGPVFQVITRPNEVTLRWDGAYTETERDPVSAKRDFEGYRVYSGQVDRDDQYSLITSWDREDYRRMAYVPADHAWKPASDPHSLAQWQVLLQDSTFTPEKYPGPVFATAYRDTFPDTLLNSHGQIINISYRERYSYWTAEAGNSGNTYWVGNRLDTNCIRRIGERDTVIAGEPLKYGIYEFTLNKLQASVPLYFAVTTFDFGDYQNNLESLESTPSTNSQYAQPIYSSDIVMDSGLKVAVYPNPYRIEYRDAWGHRTSYFNEGYESPGESEFTEYDRRIHFVNLPDTATIRIYSLFGDLIREIHHPDPHLTTYPSSVGWDLVTRNAQAVVSGIYIYRVDSRLGAQIGKIVIIK